MITAATKGPDPGAVLPLVDLIYESVLDPNHWHAFLARAADVFQATLTTLVMISPDLKHQVVTCAHNCDQASLQRFYEAVAAGGDPWMRPEHVSSGFAELSHRTTSDEALESHPAYKAFLQPMNLFYGMAMIVLVTPASLTAMGVVRPRSAGPYRDEDLALLQILHPHLHRATRLHAHVLALTQDRDNIREALRDSGAGFALVDPNGQVLFVSEAAALFFERNDGLEIQKGRLASSDQGAQRRLRVALSPEAADATILIPKRNKSELPYCLTFSKLRKAAEHPLLRPGATHCLLIKDLARESVPPRRVLGEYFAFTPAECDVAHHLANLMSTNQIAEHMRLSVHTIRTHVKQMMSKSGLDRQTELVAMLREIG
jgi:DNA-binding CsgD family transcriptional regulator/PAS domain-containing protein